MKNIIKNITKNTNTKLNFFKKYKTKNIPAISRADQNLA